MKTNFLPSSIALRHLYAGLAAALLSAGLHYVLPGAALAQELQPGETVATRERPELDPLGIRAGSFLMFPSLDVKATYNDNIFAVDDDGDDDMIWAFTPAVAVESDWSRHALNLSASTEIGRYAQFNAEDYEDVTLGASTRIDATQDSFITATANWARGHEDRGSPDDVNASVPTDTYTFGGSLSYLHRFNRLGLEPSVNVTKYLYSNPKTSSGSEVNNTDRERVESSFGIKATYQIQDEFEAFAELIGNDRRYDEALDDNGFDRDSQGYEARIGTRLDFGGKAFGNVFVGYAQQFWRDSQLQDVSDYVAGADVTFNPSGLTSITVGFTKSIAETTTNGASGYFTNLATVSVDHELLRNLILSANAGVNYQEYRGIDRDDYTYSGQFGAKYSLNRNFVAAAEYKYEQRDSDDSGGGDADFSASTIFVSLRVQL